MGNDIGQQKSGLGPQSFRMEQTEQKRWQATEFFKNDSISEGTWQGRWPCGEVGSCSSVLDNLDEPPGSLRRRRWDHLSNLFGLSITGRLLVASQAGVAWSLSSLDTNSYSVLLRTEDWCDACA